MYYYIKGTYITRGENYAVIDNNGIGYKIFTSEKALEQLSKTVGEVTLYTYLYVREDIMDLYGFTANEEIGMFLKLLSVSGVGPKAALSIMSVASVERLALAIVTGDTKKITRAAGVGPKVAQRVILELKDKIKTHDAIDSSSIQDIDTGDIKTEAVSALVVLGYSRQEANNAVSKSNGENVEDLVKEALKKLMR